LLDMSPDINWEFDCSMSRVRSVCEMSAGSPPTRLFIVRLFIVLRAARRWVDPWAGSRGAGFAVFRGCWALVCSRHVRPLSLVCPSTAGESRPQCRTGTGFFMLLRRWRQDRSWDGRGIAMVPTGINLVTHGIRSVVTTVVSA
jgi:hypothetical protein